MPRLGEFLGALLADAAQARVRADLESVKIAEAYSRDPLLRNLPVPRFRLPDMVVDVPVVVTQLEGPIDPAHALPFDEPTAKELRDVVRAGLREAGIRVPRSAVSRVPAEFVDRVTELFRSGNLRLLRPASVAEDAASLLVDVVGSTTADELPDDAAERLRLATREAMAALLTSKLRTSLSWQVAVTAEEIKAQATADGVVRLRLTISEDGYEMVDRADGTGFQLTPE